MGVGEFRVKVCVWVCVYKETDRLTEMGSLPAVMSCCFGLFDHLCKKKKTVLEPHANITE